MVTREGEPRAPRQMKLGLYLTYKYTVKDSVLEIVLYTTIKSSTSLSEISNSSIDDCCSCLAPRDWAPAGRAAHGSESL